MYLTFVFKTQNIELSAALKVVKMKKKHLIKTF